MLLAAVEGQRHILGLRMVADVLEGAGFDVLFLGADVPLDGLRGFVAEHQPAVIGLGCGIATDVRHLVQAIQAIHEVSPAPRIMLGGRAVPPGLRDAGYPFVPSSLEVLDTVQRLLDGPPQTLSEVVSTLIPQLARTASPAPEPDAADPVAERFVEAVAESSDLAREYVRQARMFRDLALRDPVTGLSNRRAFDDQLYLHTHTNAKPGVLLMIDVDGFKQVNDTHGHDAGDHTLRLVGEAIAASIRPQDFAARIGGDEFAAILPVAGLALAREVGERIRRAIAAKAALSVTVSIGVAPLAREVRAALLAADQALLQAKSGGRNQVSLRLAHHAARFPNYSHPEGLSVPPVMTAYPARPSSAPTARASPGWLGKQRGDLFWRERAAEEEPLSAVASSSARASVAVAGAEVVERGAEPGTMRA